MLQRCEMVKLPLEVDSQQRRIRWLYNTSPRLRQHDNDGHRIEHDHSDHGVVGKEGRGC